MHENIKFQTCPKDMGIGDHMLRGRSEGWFLAALMHLPQSVITISAPSPPADLGVAL